MSQIFQSAGLSCPHLDDYVANREELFQSMCTPFLNRDRLKKLFLSSLHGGCFRHKYDGYLPFLGPFERELKSCTEKLLEVSRYRHIRTLVEERELQKKKANKKGEEEHIGSSNCFNLSGRRESDYARKDSFHRAEPACSRN